MYRQFTSYIFSVLFILLFRITFFLEKQVAICTTTAQLRNTCSKFERLYSKRSLEKAPGKDDRY